MGRQAYRNRLALGRSPYEAPERPATGRTADLSDQIHRRISALHADGYVQHYDERGHPINPESKVFGREVRRAKNDVLSTMGIVVSEDRNAGPSNEQQKIDMIAAENDYGLIMATFDQVAVFLGSWWTSSLSGRIQTFKSYTHIPLLSIIKHERSSMGILGFYFSGIPAWAVSTCLSICRHQPLERLIASLQNRFLNDDPWSRMVRATLNMFHSAARGTLLILAVQTYMYSLLQSLHLVHPYSLPGIQFLLPLGKLTSIHPNLLTGYSFREIGNFAVGLLKSPSLLVYLYLYLRPVIEIRIYRLIRRRLPKPSLADELSIRVAYENDLIDWMVPTLGRRSEEENRRRHLSFIEDVMCEISFLQDLVLSWIGLKPQRAVGGKPSAPRRDERIDHLRQNIEDLQNELNTVQIRTHPLQESSQPIISPQELALQQHGEAAQSEPFGTSALTAARSHDTGYDGARVLNSEDDPISQSPVEISTDLFSEAAALGRTGNVPSISSPSQRQIDENIRLNSRSNTLLSHQSSPGTSPPTSPRVRASLIHQNSDLITMQLEVLGDRNFQNNNLPSPRNGNEIDRQNLDGDSADRRTVAEFLDSLLSSQGHSIISSDAIDSDGLSNMTAAMSPVVEDSMLSPAFQVEGQDQYQPPEEHLDAHPVQEVPDIANILPDSVEEPSQDENLELSSEAEALFVHDDDDDENAEVPPLLDSRVPRDPMANASSIPHRVTILSCHPVDSLASHIASVVTTALFIPLESLYLRSLASSYLASVGVAPLLSDVRPLGAWTGVGNVSDIVIYMGKLTLMLGLQAAVNASVWGVISGAAIKIGKRFCGWGSL